MAPRLTEQQEYLFSRIPKWYDVKPKNTDEEPASVIKARKTLSDYEHTKKQNDIAKERYFNKRVSDVKEAIHFGDPKDALRKVKELEARFPK